MAAAEKRLRGQQQRDLLRAVRVLLKEAGIDAPLTLERIDHLRRMLPEPCVSFLRLRRAYELFDNPPDREPPWVCEAPDRALLEQVRQYVPPEILATAWTDRWVTAATVASTLGISQNAARRVMDRLPTREVPNPHFRRLVPMRIVRMSDVTAWAAENRALLESWQRRLAARRQARAEALRAALRRAADDLRAVPDRIRALTDDPAPLVCWWLALLNRATKSGHEDLYSLKDLALRTLVQHGVPHGLRYLKGGDRLGWVWLCDDCRNVAHYMGMHPLDYIEVIGPCENCYVERTEHYYDLYELTFQFDGIGTFMFHVPYPVGKSYLPPPSTLPENAFSDRASESDNGWTFGRPLNHVEAAAFSVDEIVRELKAALQRITRAGEQPSARTGGPAVLIAPPDTAMASIPAP